MARLRLPLLGAPLISAREAKVATDPAPVTRSASPRVLLCVLGAEHSDDAMAFACALLEALAAKQRVAAVLLEEAGGSIPAVVARLRAAGATSVSTVGEDGATERAIAALDSLPKDAVAIALGSLFVRRLQAHLVVRVGRAGTAALRATDAVDLQVHGDVLGVAAMLGACLARCLDGLAAKG